MKRFILFILFVSSIVMCYSQKAVKVSATYTYYAPETMSVEEAKRIALDRAKIQAIADEFGTVVSQSTSTVLTNKNGQSDTHFFSIGGSEVKGEWIETIGEPKYEIRFEDRMLIITCRVEGKVREIVSAKIDFIAKPLRNGTDLKYESTEFRNGDDLYLYFKSPTNGYLTIFLLDENAKVVYSILPYKNSNGQAYPIIADKEYIFFSIKEALKKERTIVDEYVLTCSAEKEYNTIYVIFSPNEFAKAKAGEKAANLPRELSIEEFQKWLVKCKRQDTKMSLVKESIVINNN